jgi:hypothetical protein
MGFQDDSGYDRRKAKLAGGLYKDVKIAVLAVYSSTLNGLK